MQLDNHELLTLLGARRRYSVYTCPVHGGQSYTLSVIEGAGNLTYFACAAARCRFKGDAISLIAHTYKCDIPSALRMLLPGGKLQACATVPPTSAEISAYISRSDNQLYVQAYLTQCRTALRQTPDKVRLRTGISHSNLSLLPPELGLVLPNTDAPPVIRRAIKNTGGLIYPFTYNGDVTALLVQDPSTSNSGVTIPIIRDDAGAFMEQAIPTKDIQIIAPTPRIAALLYGNYTVIDAQTAPIIATLGYPLPPTYRRTRRLILLSTVDQTLSLADMLKAFGSASAIAGRATGPDIRLWRPRKRSDAITGEEIARCLVRCERLPTLSQAIVEHLAQHTTTEQLQQVARALMDNPVHPTHRAELLRLARSKNVSGDMIQLLQRDDYPATTAMRLGNGKPLRVTPSGIEGVTAANDPVPLCNVHLTPTHKVSTYKGDNLLYLDVAVPGEDVPPVSITLAARANHRAHDIRHHIVKEYGKIGKSPYIAMYNAPGYEWPDILGKLSTNCATFREVLTLGADADKCIHLPNVSIAPEGVRTQQQIFTLPAKVLTLYNAIPHTSSTGSNEPFKWLLRNCNNMYVAAFTHGLLYILYNILRGYTHGPDSAANRMLFVETETGIWDNVFTQLAAVFSNSPVPVLSLRAPLNYLNEFTALGTLPWVGQIPVLRGNKMAQITADSPVSICARVDSATATLGVGAINTTYITPAVSTPENISTIDGADIREVQSGIPGLLLDLCTRLGSTITYKAHDYPSMALYEALCEILEIAPMAMMAQVIRRTFPSIGMNGLNTLFDIMHRAVNMPVGETDICIVNGACSPDTNFTARGQHIFVMQDVVVISKAVIGIINADTAMPMRFDEELLTAELKERNMLLSCPDHLVVDTNRCWVISRAVWDGYILRQSPLTRKTLPVNVIRLRDKEMNAG